MSRFIFDMENVSRSMKVNLVLVIVIFITASSSTKKKRKKEHFFLWLYLKNVFIKIFVEFSTVKIFLFKKKTTFREKTKRLY